MENYFESQREHIFRDVHVLIYVLGSCGSLNNQIIANLNAQQRAGTLGTMSMGLANISPEVAKDLQ